MSEPTELLQLQHSSSLQITCGKQELKTRIENKLSILIWLLSRSFLLC